MARILTRPLFRKGGLSKTPRPSYRGGGLTAIRPGYRGGGMKGIMSGIVDRQPYAEGSMWNPLNWFRKGAEMLKGKPPSYGDWLKQQIAKTGQTTEGRIATGAKNLIKRGWNLFPERGVASLAMQHFPKTTATAGYVAPYALAGYSSLKQKELIDKASEKGLLDEMDFEYVDGRVLPTEETRQKIEPYKTPKQREMEASMEKGVPGGGDPKMWATKKTIDRNQQRKDDMKLAYEDLLPMFKEELGADPENVKKQSWLALAKWGQGMLAQPGGDIIGAAGKAAEKPIEDLSKILTDKTTSDREAKLLALQYAMKKTEPGAIGKTIKDLKAEGWSDEKINTYLIQSQSGDATRARLRFENIVALQQDVVNDFDVDSGSRGAAQSLYLSEQLGVKITQYKKMPKDKEKRKDGEYYVTKDGQVGRYNKKTGKLLEPGDPGFTGEME